MKRKLQQVVLLLPFLFLHALLLNAQNAANDKELLQVREAVWRTWFAGDVTKLAQLVPADTLVVSAGEKEWKHQADVLKQSAEFHAAGGKLLRLEFPKTIVQHFGNVAIVWSQYILEIQSGGKRSVSAGRASEVFVFRDGAWVNPGWHTDTDN
jgi:ketosteroid isomerase-like protein